MKQKLPNQPHEPNQEDLSKPDNPPPREFSSPVCYARQFPGYFGETEAEVLPEGGDRKPPPS